MRADRRARPEYVLAFREIVERIAGSLRHLPKRALPIRMYVAGGAALHFYTGERVSRDIDATFSRRVALPGDLEVAYRDADGAARVLYFDRQYSDTFALIHEDAHDDSRQLALPGIDAAVLDVRLLSPIDLAVSKISPLSDQDRGDIAALARHGMITSAALRKRAESALSGYVGDTDRVRTSIGLACRIIEDIERRAGKARS
ncbi:MAG: DUF6036 family nucleotidyltransferase [Gammaproteobacteria bacterium]